MNKCLSLVHLTSTIGPESSDSGQSNSRFEGRVYNVNYHRRSYIPWVAKWAGEKVLKGFVGVSYVGGMRVPKRGVGCARDRIGAITDNLSITTATGDGGGRLPKTRELRLRVARPTRGSVNRWAARCRPFSSAGCVSRDASSHHGGWVEVAEVTNVSMYRYPACGHCQEMLSGGGDERQWGQPKASRAYLLLEDAKSQRSGGETPPRKPTG